MTRDGHDHREELEAAVAAVRQAAALCREVQAEIAPDVLTKKDRSPVTVADFGSQALVCRALHEAFPGDPIIAEEDADELRKPENDELRAQVIRRVEERLPDATEADVLRWIDHGGASTYSPRFWTLDPIDGTKGFLRGEQYAVALALIVEGEVTVAAMACPNLPAAAGGAGRGAIFQAMRGSGAFVQPLDSTDGTKSIRVAPAGPVSGVRFCESVESGHSSHGDAARVAREMGISAAPVRLDSQAKYAVVARGEAAAYLRLPTRPGYVEKIWDHAAGALVVTEAGGRVTDVDGADLEFRHGPRLECNRGVIVTNGSLHDQVIAALRTVGIGKENG
ncbi:MAG: 3'(2'),5'-bisphosphate nucleotidase [Acidobacteriota bacterium]